MAKTRPLFAEVKSKDISMPSQQIEQQNSGKFGGKAAFIRSVPESMSAREVVEAAAVQGIAISVTHVYNLRRGLAKNGKSSGNTVGYDSFERRIEPSHAKGHDANVDQWLHLAIIDVGLHRAREILDAVEAIFRDA